MVENLAKNSSVMVRVQTESNIQQRILTNHLGSCQFPTLGFVVSRYLLIERFIPEAFWKIQMSYNQSQTPQQIADEEQEIRTSFKWRRNHLFNRWACLIFLEKCIEAKMARVNKVNSKQTQKWLDDSLCS
jgi:DNA topoisomerase-3